jgi:hypothetical protein
MSEEITTETIYEGSVQCPKCERIMTPLEVLYAGGKLCPDCRNRRYEYYTKNKMSEK